METGSMDKKPFKDNTLIGMKYMVKAVGLWVANRSEEEYQTRIALTYTIIALVYGIYLNISDAIHNWGNLSNFIFVVCNMLCIFLALFKMTILRAHRNEFAYMIAHAEQYFWHSNYDSNELLIYANCRRQCKLTLLFVMFALLTALCGYIVTPIMSNIGQNKSDRVLPFHMLVDWPLTESPYYEIIFFIEAIDINLIGMAYIPTDIMVCILNLHAICQFRILQYRLLKFWKTPDKTTDSNELSEFRYVSLKSCIRQHQELIKFCEHLEKVFTLTTLGHLVVFSLLMGLDCYEILLANAAFTRRVSNTAHLIGSFVHLMILTYTCHGLVEESTNITTTAYFGLWTTLPMTKTGKSLRRDIRIIMTRGMRPCCITVGGFFPVTLETFTALLTSTLSYFTLLRNSSMKEEEQ